MCFQCGLPPLEYIISKYGGEYNGSKDQTQKNGR